MSETSARRSKEPRKRDPAGEILSHPLFHHLTLGITVSHISSAVEKADQRRSDISEY